MTYTVLARKYRPRQFSQLLGQDHVVRALSNALDTQRLHHAWLFTGTRGVGKTTVSRILAKSLNCVGVDGQGGITSEPCGVCDNCKQIDAACFVDYVELDAASNRGVDEIQALLEQAVYKPVQGRFKVFMIDEVHMLSSTAFNAMLKTLEEPPEYLKFVLATTDPQKIPVTVLSRCLQFNLRPLSASLISDHLQTLLHEENIKAQTEGLAAIAYAAKGSMRDALSLTDQAIAFSGGAIDIESIRQMLGVIDSTWVLKILEALSMGQPQSLYQVIQAIKKEGGAPASILLDLTRFVHAMTVFQWTGYFADEMGSQTIAHLTRLSSALASDELQLLYSLLVHAKDEIFLAPDEWVGLEMILLRFFPFKTNAVALQDAFVTPPTPAPSIVPTASTPQKTSVSPSVAAASLQEKPASTLPSPSVDPANALDGDAFDWYAQVMRLINDQKISALTKELALQSMYVHHQSLENGVVEVHLKVASESLMQAAWIERLTDAFASVGLLLRLQVTRGEVSDSAARRLETIAQEKLKSAQEHVFEDPAIAALREAYGASIVSGTLKSHL